MSECPREDEVLDALHAGLWTGELREHTGQCAACQELAAVTGLLLQMEQPAAVLPAAGFLWWKGQLQARREQMEKAQRPMAVAEACGVVGLGAGVLLLLGTAGVVVLGAAIGVGLPMAWRAYQSE